MTYKKYKSILLFLLITIFSCRGVENTVDKTAQNDSSFPGELVTELDNKIWRIYQDKKGNYWFGSKSNGVFYFDGKNLRNITTKDGLMDNDIRGIQGDDNGNIFIQTHTGISKFDGSTITVLKPTISSSNKWKLEAGDLWFNCKGMPQRYDGKNLYELTLPKKDLKKAFGIDVSGVPFEEMNNSPYAVYGLDKDKSGNLWIGTAVAGVYRFDGESFLWIAEQELTTLPDGRVPGIRSIVEDKDGYFWLSNFISKYRISENDSDIRYEKLEGIDKSQGHFQDRLPFFLSGVADDNGDLWMTTYSGGVWKYDGEKLINYPIMDDEIEVLLTCIYKDNNGVLWLGTDNASVYKFNGEMFEKFVPMVVD